MVIIHESDVEFGPFDDNDVFHIESSALYHTVKNGVKIAEFVLYRSMGASPSIWIVEAKKSVPRSEGEKGDFDRYISDVCAKFENAHELFMAMRMGRHPGHIAELPAALSTAELSNVKFRFVLVITGASEDWLAPVKDALTLSLDRHRRIWRLDPNFVAVVTGAGARNHGLIGSP